MIPLPANPRILIIKPSSLGDVATALPMLCDLHAAYPTAQIDWLIHPAFTDLLRGHDALHQLLPFDRKGLAGWWYNPRATRALLTLRRTLRTPHYDCVIDAQGLFRSGLFAYLTRAPIRIGFASAREGATLFYTHRVTLPPQPQLAVVRMRALLKPLGIDTTRHAEARVPISPAAAAAITQRLGPDSRPAVILAGARWDTKRWSAAGYTDIIRRLLACDLPVVLVGSPGERDLCQTIAHAAGRGVLNLAGQTTIAEMVALLARARIVIGNDSGPLHVAVALARPVVALYGPTDPNLVGPYNQLPNVLRFPVPCHPCRLKTCPHHSCMQGLSTDTVWQKIHSLLQQPSPILETGN